MGFTTLDKAGGTRVCKGIGGEAVLHKLPLLDKSRVCACIAGELNLPQEQREFILRAAKCRQVPRASDSASISEQVREEPRSFQAWIGSLEAEARRLERRDIPAAEREDYLSRRVRLCEEILRLSCFAPYYSQLKLVHEFASDAVIREQLLGVFTHDDISTQVSLGRLGKEPGKAVRDMLYMSDLGNIALLGEKVSLHNDVSGPQGERAWRVFVPAAAYLIRMEAEYSIPGKMPVHYTIDRAQKEIRARLETVKLLAALPADSKELDQAPMVAIEACISNGDYAQGQKIAQAYGLAEQLGFMQELDRLVNSNPL